MFLGRLLVLFIACCHTLKISMPSMQNKLRELTQTDLAVVILCGIPGSGKTTFAKRVVSALSGPEQRWISLNQDALGSRNNVYQHAESALSHKKCVIIDRCNFDSAQRKHWIDLANRFSVKCIPCVTMPRCDDKEFCAVRATERGDDGLHDGDTDWNSVCGFMKSSFVFPTLEEGFSEIFECKTDADLDKVAELIWESQYRIAPELPESAAETSVAGSFEEGGFTVHSGLCDGGSSQVLCKYNNLRGGCRNGAACRFKHVYTATAAAAGHPWAARSAWVATSAYEDRSAVQAARPSQQQCFHFARGFCKLGNACKFAHL